MGRSHREGGTCNTHYDVGHIDKETTKVACDLITWTTDTNIVAMGTVVPGCCSYGHQLTVK